MQSACSHIQTQVAGFKTREQFRSTMLLTVDRNSQMLGELKYNFYISVFARFIFKRF